MATQISQRLVNAFERFNADLEAFRIETGDEVATLYEDAFTTRNVTAFHLYKNGKLIWVEDRKMEREQIADDDEAREWLSFWRANLRRAKKYWSMDTEKLDKIQDGEIEDEED